MLHGALAGRERPKADWPALVYKLPLTLEGIYKSRGDSGVTETMGQTMADAIEFTP